MASFPVTIHTLLLLPVLWKFLLTVETLESTFNANSLANSIQIESLGQGRGESFLCWAWAVFEILRFLRTTQQQQQRQVAPSSVNILCRPQVVGLYLYKC